MPLLGEADAKRIEALIDYVETHTAAEIVVIEAAACGAWAAQRAWLAGGLVLLGGFALHALFPALPGAWLLALEALTAPFAWWGAGHPALLHHLIPGEAAGAAVEARARQLFAERGLYKTRQRSGVLILIADLERRVSILADDGVHARLGDDEWRRDVEEITAAIRNGYPAGGLTGVIEQLGEKLAEAFPRASDDVDELSDRVSRVD
jgi:putative membrane protein